MVIDTSALIAILEDEPERAAFNQLIAGTSVRRISVASYIDASIVVEARRGRTAVHDLLVYITRAGIEIEPVTTEHAQIAVDAYRTYGKGRHQARLNFGDVFSYALAVATGDCLLVKGDDFSLTDVVPARESRLDPVSTLNPSSVDRVETVKSWVSPPAPCGSRGM